MSDHTSLGIALVVGIIIGIGLGGLRVASKANDHTELRIRLCQQQGYYDVYDKVILCSVTTTEELIKRDLNGVDYDR